MEEKLVFFEKADVNGAKAQEVFSFLKAKLPNPDQTTDIRWNFGKAIDQFPPPVFCNETNEKSSFLYRQVSRRP
jgi:glutathione peroxidase-family protein